MTMAIMLNAAADDPGSAVSSASTDPAVDPPMETTPSPVPPRTVYEVDDIGLIIGGASEDAKAKVGRLPIRD